MDTELFLTHCHVITVSTVSHRSIFRQKREEPVARYLLGIRPLSLARFRIMGNLYHHYYTRAVTLLHCSLRATERRGCRSRISSWICIPPSHGFTVGTRVHPLSHHYSLFLESRHPFMGLKNPIWNPPHTQVRLGIQLM